MPRWRKQVQVVSVIAMLQIIARCAEAVGEECWVLDVLTHQFADRRVNALHHQTRGEGHQPSTAQSGVWCLKSGCRLFCTAADRRRDSGLLWGIIILKNPYFPHFTKIVEALLYLEKLTIFFNKIRQMI